MKLYAKKDKVHFWSLVAAIFFVTIMAMTFMLLAKADMTQATKKYDHVLKQEYIEIETVRNANPYGVERTQIRQDPLYPDKYLIQEGPLSSRPYGDSLYGR